MIGPLVSVISLNFVQRLIQDYGVIYQTLPVTGATATTPILLTVPNHGFPIPENGQAPNRVCHGIVSGVVGMPEANGLWVLTGVDANSLSLATFTAQGLPTNSVGTHAYAGGGQLQYALPQGQILLGRRNVPNVAGVATPNVVFVPTQGKSWGFESYGGAIPNIGPASRPPGRGTLEQQAMSQMPQLATEFVTFDVYVNGCGKDLGNGLSPDFYDFDATQSLAWLLYSVLFDAVGGRVRVIAEDWPSQHPDAATMVQRGQQWMGRIELQQPVVKPPLEFAPVGTSLRITVEPANPGPTDPIVIDIS